MESTRLTYGLKNGKDGLLSTFLLKGFVMPIEKTCITCGEKFFVPPCRANSATTCSNKCAIPVRNKNSEKRVALVCVNCGTTFDAPVSHTNRRVYCSNECRYSSDKFRRDISARTAGNQNPAWAGGETIHSCGYVYKKDNTHPFQSNGYVFKHRLIMERLMRRFVPNHNFLVSINGEKYLSPDVDVHHVDFDRKNNGYRNLLACTKRAHGQIHNFVHPEKGTYWPENVRIKFGKKNREK